MKIVRYLAAIFLMMVATQVATAQPTDGQEGWSLEACVEYALAHNEQIFISQANEDIAQARIGQTRSMGLPQLNGGVNYTNNLAVQQQVAPDFLSPAIGSVLLGLNAITPEQFGIIKGRADTTFLGFGFGTKHSAIASLTLNQLLFDGSYFVGLQAARTYKDLSVVQTNRTRESVVENVSKAYYGVLVNEERLHLLERNVERLESILKETEALFETGFAEKIDVVRLRVNRNNLTTEQNKLKSVMALSYDILKLQMGMPIEEPLSLSTKLAGISMESEAADGSEVDFARRSDYAINEINQQLVELDIRNVRAGYLPSLRANASVGLNNGAEALVGGDEGPGLLDSEWLNFASIGVTLSIPIFDGLLKRSQVQEKQAQADQLRRQQQLLENSITMEVKQARITLDNSMATVEAQRANMKLAEEVYDIAQRKYKQGVGSNLEVLEANTSYKEAQTNYYSAVYDALIAKVDLQKALGILEY